MLVIQSQIFKKFQKVDLGISTKIGLKRTSPFEFNLSQSVGDDVKIVEENRKNFYNWFGLGTGQVKLQRQTHSDIIRYVDKNSSLEESDALITDKNNIGLGISTADCAPIFLYDDKRKLIAAVHSGWRGTEKKILSKTVNILLKDYNCYPEDIYAYIGPSINVKNYEVGEEVAGKFDKRFVLNDNGSIKLDIKKANLSMLITAGIPHQNIQVSKLCSFDCKHMLHSYRRDGEKSGRSLGMIVMKD